MGKGRLEAFSDGVIAVIITIMVLEIRTPKSPSLDGLAEVAPHIAVYALSFLYVAIYWNNHHHMFHAVTRGVRGPILWANLHLLFWLSLVPFSTAWLGENPLATVPVALYGASLLMAAVAYMLLASLLLGHEGQGSILAEAYRNDRKMMWSIVGYAVALAAAFFLPIVSLCLFAAVALAWLIPDPRIERALNVN
jgi:uncharacterized membrane protein